MHTYIYGPMGQAVAVSVVSRVRPIRNTWSTWRCEQTQWPQWRYGDRFLLPVMVAPRLITASPAQVDGPLSTPRRGLSPQ